MKTADLDEAPFRARDLMVRLGIKDPKRFWETVYHEGIPHVRVSAKRVIFPRAMFEAWFASRTFGHTGRAVK